MFGLTRTEKADLAILATRQAQPRASGWWRANCPFCVFRVGKEDTNRTFSVNIGSGGYHCFRCGVSGCLPGGVPLEMDASSGASSALTRCEADEPPDGYLPIWREPAASALCAREARDYLRGRGCIEELWEPLQIGICLKGRYQGRVIVPILSDSGDWLGWVSRLWAAGPKPYRYPKGLRSGQLLYNHQALMVETDQPVFVMEGVFDEIAVHPDGVSVLGLSGPLGVTDDQLAALLASKRPLAIAYDGDAHDRGWALSVLLQAHGKRAGSIHLPPRKDPDQVERAWLYSVGAECIQGGIS